MSRPRYDCRTRKATGEAARRQIATAGGPSAAARRWQLWVAMIDARGLGLTTASYLAPRPLKSTVRAAWRLATPEARAKARKAGQVASGEPSGCKRDSAEGRGRELDLVSTDTSLENAENPQSRLSVQLFAEALDASSSAWRRDLAGRLFDRAVELAAGRCRACEDLADAGEPWRRCRPCSDRERRQAEAAAAGDPTAPAAGAWHRDRARSIAAGLATKVAKCGGRIAVFKDAEGVRSVPQGCGARGCGYCAGQKQRRQAARLQRAIVAADRIEARKRRVRRLLTLTWRHAEDADASLPDVQRAFARFLAICAAPPKDADGKRPAPLRFTFAAVREPHKTAKDWHIHAIAWLPKFYPFGRLHRWWNKALGRDLVKLQVKAARSAAAADQAAATAAYKTERANWQAQPSVVARRRDVASRARARALVKLARAAADSAALAPGAVPGNVQIDPPRHGFDKANPGAYLAKYLRKLANFAETGPEAAAEVWRQTYGRRLVSTSKGFWRYSVQPSTLHLEGWTVLPTPSPWARSTTRERLRSNRQPAGPPPPQ